MPNGSSASVRVFYPLWTKEKLIQHFQKRLPLLAERLPLAHVVLFGSYATGRFTAASDVDLLVIYEGKPRDDAYALIRKILNVPGLEPHAYTLDEFAAVRPTVQRMERNGVVLFSEPKARRPTSHD